MSASEGGRKSAVVLLCSVFDQLSAFISGRLGWRRTLIVLYKGVSD